MSDEIRMLARIALVGAIVAIISYYVDKALKLNVTGA